MEAIVPESWKGPRFDTGHMSISAGKRGQEHAQVTSHTHPKSVDAILGEYNYDGKTENVQSADCQRCNENGNKRCDDDGLAFSCENGQEEESEEAEERWSTGVQALSNVS